MRVCDGTGYHLISRALNCTMSQQPVTSDKNSNKSIAFSTIICILFYCRVFYFEGTKNCIYTILLSSQNVDSRLVETHRFKNFSKITEGTL